MKKSSRIISTLLLGATISCSAMNVFAVESKNTIAKKVLMGQTRYETAVKASVQGWKGASDAILVNGGAIVDALSATPYAKMKNAPILLTQKDFLPQCTLDELKRLKVSKVTVVGGEGVISNNVVKALNDLQIKVERVGGSNRFETSLNLADKLENVLKVAIVNGNDQSLSDAMSVAAPAARDNMAILLTDGKNFRNSDTYIKNRKIKCSYIIGGEGVVSSEIEKAVNGIRIGGSDRRETNGKVLKEFYGKDNNFDNIYLVKDGSKDTFEQGRLKNSELVDALSIGSLASKENSPVILSGYKLSKAQREFLNDRQARFLYEVGGIKSDSISTIYDILRGIKVEEDKEDENKSSSKSGTGSSKGNKDIVGKEDNKDNKDDALIEGNQEDNKDDVLREDDEKVNVPEKDDKKDDSLREDEERDQFLEKGGKELVVTTVRELENTIKTCSNGDIVIFKPVGQVREKVEVNTDKRIIIELNGEYAEEVTVNISKADFFNKGNLRKGLRIKDIREGMFTNVGTINCITVEDKDGSSIFNNNNGVINKIVIAENAKTAISGDVEEVLVKGDNAKVSLTSYIKNMSLEGEGATVNIGNTSIVDNLKVSSKNTNLDIHEGAYVKKANILINTQGINIKNNGFVENLDVTEGATGVKIDCSQGQIKYMYGKIQYIVKGKENLGNLSELEDVSVDPSIKDKELIKDAKEKLNEDQASSRVSEKSQKKDTIDSPQEYYNAIKNALENFEEHVTLKINNYNDSDYSLDVVNKVLLENPDIDYGYSSVGGVSGYSNSNVTTLELNISYREKREKLIEEKNAVKAKIREIINSEIKPGMSTVEKEIALHDYLVKHARYDKEKVHQQPPVTEDHNAYGVLCLGIGVCESYAKATYELFNAAGIECKYVTGFGNGGPHAWNMVKLDGEWYNLDVTWDDPVVENEDNKTFPVQYNYFNKTDADFGNHVRDEKVITYPKCTATRYSVDNLSDKIKFVDKDGNEYKTVKSIDELDNLIKEGIRSKKANICFRVSGFKMDLGQLGSKAQTLFKGANVGYRYGSNGDCFTITPEWK